MLAESYGPGNLKDRIMGVSRQGRKILAAGDQLSGEVRQGSKEVKYGGLKMATESLPFLPETICFLSLGIWAAPVSDFDQELQRECPSRISKRRT